jgi:hypothetical protein
MCSPNGSATRGVASAASNALGKFPHVFGGNWKTALSCKAPRQAALTSVCNRATRGVAFADDNALVKFLNKYYKLTIAQKPKLDDNSPIICCVLPIL